MNKLIIYIFITIIILTSCQKENRDDKLEEKKIELKEYSEPALENNFKEDEVKAVETLINVDELFPGKVAVEKKDSNLDLDTATEQFIVLIDDRNQITLVVVDTNKITREHFVAWKVELPILYNSDFSMTEQDVLGIKHNLELIVRGTTGLNNNALYIFKKTAPPKGIHIYYKTIYSYHSSGTVEIVTINRDLDYNERRKDYGKAYDILVEKTSVVNETTLSITSENWVWDRRRNYFIKESSNTVEEKINVKEKLRTIYTGNKSEFINFISGEWKLDLENSDENRIIIIDYTNNNVIMRYKDGVEQYLINRSWKSYKRLTLNLRNIEVSTIPKQLNITLNSTDNFSIISKTPTAWDGEYTRLSREDKVKLISETNTDIKREAPFTGIFKNVSHSINFSYPEYKKIDVITGQIEEGTFSILELSNKRLVLQLKTQDETNSEFLVTNYDLNYTQQNLESQIIRTIKIHEGRLTTHGIEVKSDQDAIKFEQTEVISNE